MDAQFYVVEILLSNGLLPFIQERFPDGHRFQRDNDPKHTSRLASSFMTDNGINWSKTPPGSLYYFTRKSMLLLRDTLSLCI